MKLSSILTHKKSTLAMVVMSSLISFSANASDVTVNTQKVSYQCQSNKQITVTYGFNEEGLPTYAAAKLEGKFRFMPLNFARTEGIDTAFGTNQSYSLATTTITSHHPESSILITSPKQEIIYKNCDPK